MNTELNPATKLPHTAAYLARTNPAPALVGPFRATDVKTPEGWQIVTTGYGASRVVDHAPSRDKARARAREMTAQGVTTTREVTA
jgi:hypothetical protein